MVVIEGPLATLVAALILCVVVVVPAAFVVFRRAFRWLSALDFLSYAPE